MNTEALLDLIEQLEQSMEIDITLEHGWSAAHSGPATSRAIVVLGATRSGTSAVAGVLHHMGCRMRGQKIAGPANPRGTFEDEEFLGIQLDREDCREADQKSMLCYAQAIRNRNRRFAVWGVKEPRLAFILEHLLPFFEDVRFVFVVRDVAATKRSYDKWEKEVDAPPIDEQIRELSRCVELIDGQYDRIGVHYEKLLKDPRGVIGRLAQFVYDGLDIMPTEWSILRAVRSIDPGMRHF